MAIACLSECLEGQIIFRCVCPVCSPALCASCVSPDDISSRGGGFGVANSFIFLQPDGSPVKNEPALSTDSTTNPAVIPHRPIKVCLPLVGCVVK